MSRSAIQWNVIATMRTPRPGGLRDQQRGSVIVDVTFTGQDLFTEASDVAEAVWRAVHDTTGRLRFPAGPEAVWLTTAK